MILNSTFKAYGQFLDQITTPAGKLSKAANERRLLARRLKNIAGDLSLEGRDADVKVIYDAIDALGGL